MLYSALTLGETWNCLFDEISLWFWLDLGKACKALAQKGTIKPWSVPALFPTLIPAWVLEAVVPRATTLETLCPLSITLWSRLLLTITPFLDVVKGCRDETTLTQPCDLSSVSIQDEASLVLHRIAQSQLQELPSGCAYALCAGRRTESSL